MKRDSSTTPYSEEGCFWKGASRLCTWPKCDCGGAHGIVEGCPVEEEAGTFCACGNDLRSEQEQRDKICRECL